MSDPSAAPAVRPVPFADPLTVFAALRGDAVPALVEAGVTVVEFHPAWFGRSEGDFDAILEGMVSVR